MYGPILAGEKISLQPPEASEAERYVVWLRDPEVTRFVSSFTDVTIESEREFLKNIAEDATKVFWSVYTKDGKHIGSTDLHGLALNHKRTSWGVMIGDKSEWNKGYGADVLRTLADYAFGKLKLNRFELEVFDRNAAGIACYRKCGFKTEGVKRKCFVKNGQVHDSILMALTDDDYEELKKNNADKKSRTC